MAGVIKNQEENLNICGGALLKMSQVCSLRLYLILKKASYSTFFRTLFLNFHHCYIPKLLHATNYDDTTFLDITEVLLSRKKEMLLFISLSQNLIC